MISFNLILYFSIASFIILILISIVYFKKKKIKSIETNIYSFVIVITLISLFLEILSGLVLNPELIQFRFFLKKLFMISIIIWETIILIYSLYISYSNADRLQKNKNIIITIASIILISTFFLILLGNLNANYDLNGKIINTYGLSQTIFSVTAIILIFCILTILLINIKKI